ncbi:hypothetical protein HOG16_01975 [Candidatus Woesearchaeota archaeon]|jgi:hypothetical protein|nr:hypothetical protein [Candidatus Woesearchaeota archaeon]MBT4321663.1 hypothetical protein [Candidatus Woesearchaeota archaeon]MBT4631026.1 hypothetical protein [Candidatus Woesearchaeota archaeon]
MSRIAKISLVGLLGVIGCSSNGVELSTNVEPSPEIKSIAESHYDATRINEGMIILRIPFRSNGIDSVEIKILNPNNLGDYEFRMLTNQMYFKK